MLSFGLLLLLSVVVIIVYVALQDQVPFWHSSLRRELGFWTVWSSALAAIVLGHPGSPVSFVTLGQPWLALLGAALVAWLVRSRVRRTMLNTYLSRFAMETRHSAVPHFYIYSPADDGSNASTPLPHHSHHRTRTTTTTATKKLPAVSSSTNEQAPHDTRRSAAATAATTAIDEREQSITPAPPAPPASSSSSSSLSLSSNVSATEASEAISTDCTASLPMMLLPDAADGAAAAPASPNRVWTRRVSQRTVLRRVRAATSLVQQPTETTKSLMAQWSTISQSLDATTTFRYLMRRTRIREHESQLLELLVNATKHDLNYMVQHINLPLTVAAFRQNQLQLLTLLATANVPPPAPAVTSSEPHATENVDSGAATTATEPPAADQEPEIPATEIEETRAAITTQPPDLVHQQEHEQEDKEPLPDEPLSQAPDDSTPAAATSLEHEPLAPPSSSNVTPQSPPPVRAVAATSDSSGTPASTTPSPGFFSSLLAKFTPSATTPDASQKQNQQTAQPARQQPHPSCIIDPSIRGRLGELNVISKCIVLDALQKAIHRVDVRQQFIESIALSVVGEDLSTFRTLLDSRGEWHNLHKLLFKDIKDPSIRERILAHIANNNPVALYRQQINEYHTCARIKGGLPATAVPATNTAPPAANEEVSTSTSTPPSDGLAPAVGLVAPPPPAKPIETATTTTLLKILSDIDDTLFCSGGPPAGADKRLPKHTLYPGVLCFYRELDLATDSDVQRCVDAGHAITLAQLRGLTVASSSSLNDAVVAASALPASSWTDDELSFEHSMRELAECEDELELELQAGAMFSVSESSASASNLEPDDAAAAAAVRSQASEGADNAWQDWLEAEHGFLMSDEEDDRTHSACGDSGDSGDSGDDEDEDEDDELSLAMSPVLAVVPATERERETPPTLLPATPPSLQRSSPIQQLSPPLPPPPPRPLFAPRLLAHGNLTFLSARPHLYKGFSERASYQSFKTMLGSHGMHTIPNLLPGDVASSAPVLVGKMRSVASKKFSNFQQYAALYPEYSFTFIGDNGQGDVDAGLLMLRHYGGQVKAVFIHRVVPVAPAVVASASDEKLFYCNTYVEAALLACCCSLISTESVYRVAKAALQDLAAIAPKLKPKHQSGFAQYRELLRNDVATVNQLISLGAIEGDLLTLPDAAAIIAPLAAPKLPAGDASTQPPPMLPDNTNNNNNKIANEQSAVIDQ